LLLRGEDPAFQAYIRRIAAEEHQSPGMSLSR